MNLQEFKPVFDEALDVWLYDKLSSVEGLFPDPESFDLLTYLTPYVNHGKRFRPYMVYLRYHLYGGDDDAYITQVGIMSEMIHIFALIHDDICDRGILRHGIPTYHEELAKRYNDYHFGMSQSIIIGDLALTRAFQQAKRYLTNKDAYDIVFTMMNEVIVGEILDIHFSHQDDKYRSADTITSKDHLKSGQYSFQKPMMIGASLAGCDETQKVQALGKKIGLAFQMRDDLLDWIPNSEGKTKMSDIQEGNQTIVLDLCREEMSSEDFGHIRNSRGQQLDADQIGVLQNLFDSYQIKDKVMMQINKQLDQVKNDFEALDTNSDFSPYFMDIVGLLSEI